MQLQTARQLRNEGPQEFADRCRALAQKLVCKVDDPQAQRIHQENAERMLLAAFVNGLTGTPGKQCRFSSPQNVQQALSIALTVEQAEKQDRFYDSFYTRYDKTVRLLARSPSRKKKGEERPLARITHIRVNLVTEVRIALENFRGASKRSPHSAVMSVRG